MSRIAVVGAGITGVTTAYALLERGHDVTVFDRNRYAAMGTSFANGGKLSASNAEVWNKPSTIIQGMRWMMRHDAPLLINPLPSWHKYPWFAEFAAGMSGYRWNNIETVRLAIAAREHLFQTAEREGIAFDLEKRGILHFYGDKIAFEKAKEVNGLLREGGLDRLAVMPQEIRSIEPALRGACYGGFFTASDSTGDIHKFTRGLAAASERRGVTFVYDAVVDAIVSLRGSHEISWRAAGASMSATSCEAGGRLTVDAIVVCAGTASRHFAALLGDRINIYPVKGHSITVRLHSDKARAAAPQVSILDDLSKVVTSRLGQDRFRVAGTAEVNGFDRDIRSDRVEPRCLDARVVPDVSTDQVESWTGLRPMTPRMMPRVGRGHRPGVFYNTGHGHLGWTLAAATSQLAADAVPTSAPQQAA